MAYKKLSLFGYSAQNKRYICVVYNVPIKIFLKIKERENMLCLNYKGYRLRDYLEDSLLILPE